MYMQAMKSMALITVIQFILMCQYKNRKNHENISTYPIDYYRRTIIILQVNKIEMAIYDIRMGLVILDWNELVYRDKKKIF